MCHILVVLTGFWWKSHCFSLKVSLFSGYLQGFSFSFAFSFFRSLNMVCVGLIFFGFVLCVWFPEHLESVGLFLTKFGATISSSSFPALSSFFLWDSHDTTSHLLSYKGMKLCLGFLFFFFSLVFSLFRSDDFHRPIFQFVDCFLCPVCSVLLLKPLSFWFGYCVSNSSCSLSLSFLRVFDLFQEC